MKIVIFVIIMIRNHDIAKILTAKVTCFGACFSEMWVISLDLT